MTAQDTIQVRFHGHDLLLCADGTIFFPDKHYLLVSDLHLEKGAALSTAAPIPQFDTADTLARLQTTITRFNPQKIICLGDSFHSNERAFRMPATYSDQLQKMGELAEFIWITGNHDSILPDRLPGKIYTDYQIDNLRLTHEADNLPMTPTLSGHFHPKARIKLRARHLSTRCFVQNSLNIIMPAFGSYTGGLNIIDKAFAPFIDKQTRLYLCHDNRIYGLPFKAAKLTKSL
ncbi:MAG: ligase-associated DNA damage response endonuclease PdeM [Candidatus Puniceispirillaceae bacterium]